MRRAEQKNVSKEEEEPEALQEHGARWMRLSIRKALTLEALQERIADLSS